MRHPMYDSFIDQLSGLDLSGLSIRPAPFNETDFPCEDAIDQTLGAVWSDLFAMFSDTALEADAEDTPTAASRSPMRAIL